MTTRFHILLIFIAFSVVGVTTTNTSMPSTVTNNATQQELKLEEELKLQVNDTENITSEPVIIQGKVVVDPEELDETERVVIEDERKEEDGKRFSFLQDLSATTFHFDRLTVYISSGISVAFLVVTLVQRRQSTGDDFRYSFVLVNLLSALTAIQILFLFGFPFKNISIKQTSEMSSHHHRVIASSASFSSWFSWTELEKCNSYAFLLHFLHLSAGFWMLSHSIVLYEDSRKADKKIFPSNPSPEEEDKQEQMSFVPFLFPPPVVDCWQEQVEKEGISIENQKILEDSFNYCSVEEPSSFVDSSSCHLATLSFPESRTNRQHHHHRHHRVCRRRSTGIVRWWTLFRSLVLSNLLRLSPASSSPSTSASFFSFLGFCSSTTRGSDKRSFLSSCRAWESRHFFLFSWMTPLIIIAVSYHLNPGGYEIKR